MVRYCCRDVTGLTLEDAHEDEEHLAAHWHFYEQAVESKRHPIPAVVIDGTRARIYRMRAASIAVGQRRLQRRYDSRLVGLRTSKLLSGLPSRSARQIFEAGCHFFRKQPHVSFGFIARHAGVPENADKSIGTGPVANVDNSFVTRLRRTPNLQIHENSVALSGPYFWIVSANFP